MIMIDVLIPPLDIVYDFEVNDAITPENLLSQVETIIHDRLNVSFKGNDGKLFTYRKGDFLKNGVPLGVQGIGNGDRLILV